MNFWKNRIKPSPVEKKQRKNDRFLLIVSGIIVGISFPPFPFPFQLLMFIGFIPLFYVIEKREKLIDVNRAVYLFGVVLNIVTVYWVGSWQPKADPFLMISGILLIFVNPALFLIPSTLYYFSRDIFKVKVSLFLLPIFWVSYEYLFMITELSFPWITFGSGLSHFNSFIQIADIIGAQGLTFIVLTINMLLFKTLINYKVFKRTANIELVVAILIFISVLLYGIIRQNTFKLSAKKVKVGLIQPNLDPWEKWSGTGVLNLAKEYLNYSKKAIDKGAEILIWPETALPVYLMSPTYKNVVDTIHSFLNKENVFLLTGMPDIIYYTKDEHPDYAKYSKAGDFYYATHNAILLFSPNINEFQRYGKMKLVPFGERVPFINQLPFLGDLFQWGVGISGWNVGRDTIVFKLPYNLVNKNRSDTLRINGLVCYESIYPFLVANFVNRGADFIAVVTNDSWYGNSSGPYQHKEFSVLRAVENRKTVVRAANGGISCIIDPLGNTTQQSKMFEKDVIIGDVILQHGKTFFTKHSLIIPIIATAFSVWVLGVFILKKLKIKFKL